MGGIHGIVPSIKSMESVKCCGCRIGVDFCQGWDGRIAESKQGQTLAGGAPDWQCSSSGPRTLSDTQHFPLHPIEVLKRRRKQLQLSWGFLSRFCKRSFKYHQHSSTFINYHSHESWVAYDCLIFFHNAANLSTLLWRPKSHGVIRCQVDARAFVYHQPMDGREKEVVYFPSASVSFAV